MATAPSAEEPLYRLDVESYDRMVGIHTPGWLAQRREIRSFFIAEVDRDKVAA